MKTTGDVETILYQKMKAAMEDEISGGVFKKVRPDSSKSEDVVINTLGILPEHPQICTANINIHVPAISMSGQVAQPDTARMNFLTKLATDALDYFSQEYTLFIERQRDIREESTGQWYSNLQVRLTYYN